MREAPESASPTNSQLHSALLDYFKAPGKYQLTLRQPALLFGAIREILQIAAGRGGPEPTAAAANHEVREAAAFFIRAALLYPGADHYAVLGLAPGTQPVELKERYRLLMRLIHPDYAETGSVHWPADAAVRVNRAYEILASQVLRQEYDEQLAGLRTPRTVEPSPANRRPAAARVPVDARGLRGNRTLGWALVALATLGAAALLMPSQEAPQLVQKTAPRVRVEQTVPATPRIEREPEAAVLAATESLSPAAEAARQPAPAVAPPAVSPTPTPPVVAAAAPPAPMPPPAAPSPAPSRPIAAQPPVAAARPAAPVPAISPPRPAAPPVAARPAADPRSGIRTTEMPLPPPAPVPPPLAPVRPAVEPTLALAPAQPVPPPPVAPSPPVPAAPAVTRVSTVVPVASGPTLAEAQPVLTQLLQVLESGSGDQLLRLLDGEARQSAGAQALSRQYEQLVRGGRPIRLMHVDFRGEPRDGTLLVTGRIRLHAGEPTVSSHGERLLVRAEFASRGGRVQLTGLSGGAD